MNAQPATATPAQTASTDPGSLARLCKALADPLRLGILRLLRTESFGVLELSRIVGVRQSALSHHLKVLATAGLVSTRREGTSIFYRRSLLLPDDPWRDFKRQAFHSIDELSLAPGLQDGITTIQQERARQSLAFFSRHADQFSRNQALIAEYDQYEATLHDLLDGLRLSRNCSVIEVGPGEGALLGQLADRYDNVTALDNSLEMLNRARSTIHGRRQEHVQFVHGDTTTGVEQGLSADLIVSNMVLHHIPSPAAALQDCARMLKPGGQLLLIDLSRHDQDWAREACGDLWLGFEDHDLDDWTAQAGLLSGQRLYLGQRNGFQVLIRLFLQPDISPGLS
jgi:ArsR family transcriptional regulator